MPLAPNPFYVRTSEQASSDTRFLTLFGPSVLTALTPGELWDRLIVFRSAPGGGKTSILRLFTPGALRSLHQNRQHETTKKLADILADWGVLDDRGPTVLGTRLSCDQYAALRDITDDATRRRQLFFALINARVILAALRGAVALGTGQWPTDVSRVRFERGTNDDFPVEAAQLFPEADGQALYNRACEIERDICVRLNELDTSSTTSAPMHSDLWALHVLSGKVWYDDQPIAERVLITFDDVQMLHQTQRADLRKALMSRRIRVARWMAERWQGLGPEEVFDHGATRGRDYQIVALDGWTDEANQRSTRFERTVSDIANRRTQSSEVMQEQALTTAAFDAFLQETGDAPPARATLEKAIADARHRVLTLAGTTARYAGWIAEHGHPGEQTVDALQRWRGIEILIERDKRHRQSDLFPDEQLSKTAFLDRNSSDVTAAAEVFISRDYGMPYYYGMHRLALLASWNIEQFLDLAGDCFDLVTTAVTLKKPAKVTPKQQHDIVRRAAKEMLQAIPRRVPHGVAVRTLLEHVGAMCADETFRPSAPYSPGVTGFAISMADLEKLKDGRGPDHDSGAKRLMNVLTTAVWNNLLQVKLDYACKNRMWAVFYLNRLLCAHYSLPLQYGGFREKKLTEVMTWVAHVEPPMELGLSG